MMHDVLASTWTLSGRCSGNLDGDLDLFITIFGRTAAAGLLFGNQGDGTFTPHGVTLKSSSRRE